MLHPLCLVAGAHPRNWLPQPVKRGSGQQRADDEPGPIFLGLLFPCFLAHEQPAVSLVEFALVPTLIVADDFGFGEIGPCFGYRGLLAFRKCFIGSLYETMHIRGIRNVLSVWIDKGRPFALLRAANKK